MKEFEQLTRKIFDLTHQYAIDNLPLNYDTHPSKWKEEDVKQFQIYVHKGFKQAQELILNEVLKLQDSTKKLNNDLKSCRRSKETKKAKEIENEITLVKHKEVILRSFIDFIAWQFLGGQYYKVRRFYDARENTNSRPTLASSNIQSIVDAVEYYHSQDESNFALISDLTSFIDIGDLLLLQDGQVTPIELKEGQTNEEVFQFITEISKKEINTCPYSLISNPNEKFFKQVNRVLNQMKRGYKLTDFLKDEKGKDPFTDSEVRVNKDAYQVESYIDIVNSLFKSLEKKDWAYTIFEDVITIGLYQNELFNMGDILLPELNKKMFGKEFPVINYLQKLHTPINEPIYYQGLSKEHIFDLFFGRIRMLISINLDNFIALCNTNGLNARYLTKKETMNSKKRHKNIDLFEWKKQAIIIDEKLTLCGGIIGRMVFDFTKPSSISNNFKLQLAEKVVDT